MNSQTKQCQNCKASFVIDADDFGFYEKMGVPAPGLCPNCRFKRRALFRNETTLYSRKCALCAKQIVSMYNPTSPYTVYCDRCWESDTWDPFSYGINYDTTKPFFDQLQKLFIKVPKKATFISSSTKLGPNINSEYCNVAGGNKDSYLVFNGGGSENLMYSRGASFSRDSMDAYFGVKLERCYETVNVSESSGIQFGHNVLGSLDSMFLLNGSGCQQCFACVNLRHKSYHFFNEPIQKAEYERRINEIKGSYQKIEEMKKKFAEFSLKFPRRENNNLKTVHSTGDYLLESKNLSHCFETAKCEDSKYLFSVKLAKDCYDGIGFGYDSELLLENVGTGYSRRVMACYATENSQETYYSFMSRKLEHAIGADGIRGGKYIILNKRYSEGEYSVMRDHIVQELKSLGEWGLYMPPAVAPFAYNETIGQDNMPLTRDKAIVEGLRWEDNLQITKGKETIKSEAIPDHIRDVQDSILKEVLACISCGRNYRIIGPELQLYRRLIIPIPRKCFYCRHQDRIARRGPFKLFDRTCDHCKKPIKTNFAPGRPEIVYCKRCYPKEVL